MLRRYIIKVFGIENLERQGDRHTMGERFDGEEKKGYVDVVEFQDIDKASGRNGSGFGKGFFGGFVAAFVLIGVVLGGMTVGKNLAAQKPSAPSVQQTAASDESVSGQEQQDPVVEQQDNILDAAFIEEINTIYEQLQYCYLYDINVDDLHDGMLQGMLAALGDPYTVYYNESDLSAFTTQTEGEYYGIGCMVTQNLITGVISIVTPYVGAPAYEAGILPGDILYAVDGEPVTGEDLDQVVLGIKGKSGTTVELTIVREGVDEYLYFNVERRKVKIPSVEHEMKDDQIGYIMVTSFDAGTAKDFIDAYEDLKTQGMKGLVIDMRDNGGGLLSTVEDMLDYLLPKGVIFYAKDKYGNKYLEYTSDKKAALDVPLTILINGNTASAAEVFSGNIQAFGMATLVGTNTYGKGVMQNTFATTPEGNTAIKVTVADYYIHGDRNIHGVGIAPDVEIELNREVATQVEIADEDDNQLQEALRIVREQLQ